MTIARIRSAFENRLSGWADARLPPIPVAWENVNFSSSLTYLRAYVLPAETTTDLEGAYRGYSGIFQASIFVPRGTGVNDAQEIVEELDALFPVNDRITVSGLTVQIITPMSPSPWRQDDDFISTAVRTRYRADI